MYKRALRDMVGVGNNMECRYWSPVAQAHAAGDQLVRYLEEGWLIDDRVEVETRWYGEGRHALIYHLTLRRDNRRLLMALLANPFAQELFHHEGLAFTLVPVRTPRRRVKVSAVPPGSLQASEVRL